MQATNENRWKLIKNINSLRHATGEYFKRTHTHARPTPMHTHTHPRRTQQLKISPGPYPRERMVPILLRGETQYLIEMGSPLFTGGRYRNDILLN